MRNWQIADLDINADAVLRGQGADPDIIRSRSPRLIDIAETAINDSLLLIEPKILTEELKVLRYQHEILELENDKKLSGPLVTGHLVGAQSVIGVVCTVGSKIDQYASEVMEDDMVLGLAIDGVGSAAVEALANAVCRQIELDAAAMDSQTTIPLSPGMIGWDVEIGQSLIFDIMKPNKIGVELTPYYLMVPRKSLSMLIGTGPDINSGEKICDYCAMRETCRYTDQYRELQG
jgi:hypothetical protein